MATSGTGPLSRYRRVRLWSKPGGEAEDERGHLVDGILGLHGREVLLAVFLFQRWRTPAFIGFVLPGEIAELLGGVLAFKHRASQPAVIVAAVAGVIIVNPSVLLATLPVTAEHVARAYADEAITYLPHTDQPRTYPEPASDRSWKG